jgi:hypothetical protein
MTEEPKLAPPGAGLPAPERFIGSLMVHWGRWRTSRSQAIENFARSREEILRLVQRCDAVAGEQRVLIRRLPGLEDSSRYWSVFMTLDHLRIVNDAMAGAIRALVAGQVPKTEASTAAVKPGAKIGAAVIAAFEDSCRNLERVVADAPDLATQAKYAHPWFGPLDAAGWHFMAGFHMNLHRRQIEAILAGLGKSA